MRWTVCVWRCTRSGGCLTMIEVGFGLLRRVQLQRQLTFLMRKRRALGNKTHHKCRFLSTACAPTATGSNIRTTRRARMARRPPVAECRDEQPACAPTFLQTTKYHPTRHDRKQDTPSGTTANTLNRCQPTRNVQAKPLLQTTKSAQSEHH